MWQDGFYQSGEIGTFIEKLEVGGFETCFHCFSFSRWSCLTNMFQVDWTHQLDEAGATVTISRRWKVSRWDIIWDYHEGLLQDILFDTSLIVSVLFQESNFLFSKTRKLTCLSVDRDAVTSIADGVIFRLWRPQLRFGDAHRVKVQWAKSGDAAEMEPWVREWYSYNGIVWVNMFRVGSLEAGVMMRSFQDWQKCEVQDFECQVCFALWALKERWGLVRV